MQGHGKRRVETKCSRRMPTFAQPSVPTQATLDGQAPTIHDRGHTRHLAVHIHGPPATKPSKALGSAHQGITSDNGRGSSGFGTKMGAMDVRPELPCLCSAPSNLAIGNVREGHDFTGLTLRPCRATWETTHAGDLNDELSSLASQRPLRTPYLEHTRRQTRHRRYIGVTIPKDAR